MTGILLDTHIFVWSIAEPRRLSAREYKMLTSHPADKLWVSHGSLWEIAIKAGSGKLTLPKNFFSVIRQRNIRWLPHRFEHMEAYLELPKIPEHSDPFDRMLIAQAKTEKLTIMTRDREFRLYNIPLADA
jgi:PIN domain nuclease of toxin-antitoxin system